MKHNLAFQSEIVTRMIKHSEASQERSPTFDQMFDSRYHKPGVVLDSDDWPKSEIIDRTKIPAGLFLVGDRGIYLMSNGLPSLLRVNSSTDSVVAYLYGCNPHLDNEWYDHKADIWGQDDGAIFVPASDLKRCLENNVAGSTMFLKATFDDKGLTAICL